MTNIVIPATIDAAKESLAGLDGLITAKEWERAAIVYAFTRDGIPGEGGPGRQDGTSTILLPSEFAALGVAGLRSDKTVRRHRKAWQDAIDAGEAEDVFPGNKVTLPNLAWGEIYVSERREDGRTSEGGTVELPQTKDPEKLRDHFTQHPDSAQRIADALPPRTRSAIADQVQHQRTQQVQVATGQRDSRPEAPNASRARTIADFIGSASTNLQLALRNIPDGNLTDSERTWLGERLGDVQGLVDRISDGLSGALDESEIYAFLKEQA